jgi:hypothetical protein
MTVTLAGSGVHSLSSLRALCMLRETCLAMLLLLLLMLSAVQVSQ